MIPSFRLFAAQTRRLAVTLALAAALVWLAGPRARAASRAPRLYVLVSAEAARAGVPARLAHAIVAIESGYRAGARSSAGALGIGQIKCRTARGVGVRGACARLFDPSINLRFAMRYLRMALNRGGAGCAGLSLYQRGIYARPRCTAYGRKALHLTGA